MGGGRDICMTGGAEMGLEIPLGVFLKKTSMGNTVCVEFSTKNHFCTLPPPKM